MVLEVTVPNCKENAGADHTGRAVLDALCRSDVSVLRFGDVDVHCASRPTEQRPRDRNTRGRGKLILASRLWREFLAVRHQSDLRHTGSASGLRIVSGGTGRPRLLVGESEGPCISFSHGESHTWAALCKGTSCCGIDVAGAAEFAGGYPFHRAFHDEELRLAGRCIGLNQQEKAAMLWSAKEAVVKALGCGFHLIGPLDVEIGHLRPTDDGSWSIARVNGRGLTNEHTWIPVYSFPSRCAWVSVSVVGKDHAF